MLIAALPTWGKRVTCDSSMEMAVWGAWKYLPMYLIISATICEAQRSTARHGMRF